MKSLLIDGRDVALIIDGGYRRVAIIGGKKNQPCAMISGVKAENEHDAKFVPRLIFAMPRK